MLGRQTRTAWQCSPSMTRALPSLKHLRSMLSSALRHNTSRQWRALRVTRLTSANVSETHPCKPRRIQLHTPPAAQQHLCCPILQTIRRHERGGQGHARAVHNHANSNTPRSDAAALLSPRAHREERSTCDVSRRANQISAVQLAALLQNHRAPREPYPSAAHSAGSSAARQSSDTREQQA